MQQITQSLIEKFVNNSSVTPNFTLVEDSEYSLSCAECLVKARRFSRHLIENDFKFQDRLVISIRNSAFYVPLIFGTMMAGGVFVLVNPSTKGKKLEHILKDCEPHTIVCESRNFFSTIENKLPESKVVCIDEVDDCKSNKHANLGPILLSESSPLTFRESQIIGQDLACIIYTSGSTGAPKGVMHTHYSLLYSTASISHYLKFTARDRILNILPLSYSYGLTQLLLSVYNRAYLHLSDKAAFPAEVNELFSKFNITVFPSVPTFFQLMLPHWEHSRPDLRIITSAGEDLLPATVSSLHECFGDTQIFKMYGMTECIRISFLSPKKLYQKPKSAGQAIPGTRVFVLDEDNRPIKPGETGVLHVQGSHIMRGYWRLPELTKEVTTVCDNTGLVMLRSGDKFTIDEQGDLYFCNRTDSIFKVGGIKVNPAEVENCILQVPDVIACAVTYSNICFSSRELLAFVVGKSDTKIKSIYNHCKLELENHLIPRKIFLVSDLPTGANGKLNRRCIASREYQIQFIDV